MSEESLIPMLKEQCEVFQSSYTNNVYDIILDEPIREPAYYRQAFHVLRTSRQGDRINVIISSPGGRLDSAITFINLFKETEAEVLAVIDGEAHSAASMIALSAHGVHVKPYASMMIHHASFGSGGTVQNVMDHVNFTSKQTEKLIRDVYKYYLSEEEISEVIRNREIWLTDEEIGERLDRMYEARHNEPCDCGNCDLDGEDSEDLEPMLSLQDMLSVAVEEGIEKGINKALTALLKKHNLVPKEAKKPSVKTQKVVDKAEDTDDTLA